MTASNVCSFESHRPTNIHIFSSILLGRHQDRADSTTGAVYYSSIHTLNNGERGSTRRYSNRRLFALLIQRNRCEWSLRIISSSQRTVYPFESYLLWPQKVCGSLFGFPVGGGPSVDLIFPFLFVRPPGSFARRGAEPHHYHHQRSRCLCVSARAVRTRVPCYPTTMNSDINMYLGREKTGIMRKRALLLRKGCSFEITR